MGDTTIWRESASIIGAGYTFHGHDLAAGLQVYFGVWPVALGHTAGAVWTCDGWKTTNWGQAHWVQNVANQFGGFDECWELNILNVVESPVRFWYALWVDDSQGCRHWDNNHGWNYETAFIVTPS